MNRGRLPSGSTGWAHFMGVCLTLSLFACHGESDTERPAFVNRGVATSPSAIAVPSTGSTHGSPSASVLCDAPFPTVDQRWDERLATTISFPPEPGAGNFRGKTLTHDEKLSLEVRAMHGGAPSRVTRGFLLGEWRTEDVEERAADSEQRFWVGKESWAAALPRDLRSERFSRAALHAMAAALAHRLASVLGAPSPGKSYVRLAPPVEVQLPWGNALLFAVRARGRTGSMAAGQWISEELELEGQLTARAGDGALVSLVLEGHDMLTEQWPALNTRYPPVRGSAKVRFESSCFATKLRPGAN